MLLDISSLRLHAAFSSTRDKFDRLLLSSDRAIRLTETNIVVLSNIELPWPSVSTFPLF